MKVLDHGYVDFVESWGSDQAIIEAARMSTDGAFRGWGPTLCHKCDVRGNVDGIACKACKGTRYVPGDERLLRYLYEHKHATPFEMAGLIIEVKAPIFVFREWHRHRTQSYNEMSARYAPLPDENYIPDVERVLIREGKNKQASSAGTQECTRDDALAWLWDLQTHYTEAQTIYERALGCGIPKELARIVLPVGRYSKMRASANLRNWLAFLTLRMAPDAQWEIRQYANAVSELISKAFPRTWELFSENKSK
jgi:thymidylate synthase (FAD)